MTVDIIRGLQKPRTTEERHGPRPELKVLGKFAGANVVRIAFAAGEVFPAHQAARPIIVMGQTGRVRFTAEGETVVLEPGTAVHVEANVPHDLATDEDSTVTLFVLTDPSYPPIPSE